MNVSLSILHYGPYEVTKECVDSILQLEGSDKIKIVIVDNHSSNQSLEKLMDSYERLNNISFICNDSNLGFGKGNNKGFCYAKDSLKADIIGVLNNDILIKQPDFFNQLSKCVREKKADIIAPSIVNSKGYYQNPLRLKELTISEIINALIYNCLMLGLYKIPVVNVKVAQYLENRRNTRINKEEINEIWSIVPHGAAIFYGPEYIKKENFAFLDNTFLFGEEDFLYEYLKKKCYTTLYYPKLKIIHNEDSSIKSITRNDVSKRAFISKKKIGSLMKLLIYRLCK